MLHAAFFNAPPAALHCTAYALLCLLQLLFLQSPDLLSPDFICPL